MSAQWARTGLVGALLIVVASPAWADGVSVKVPAHQVPATDGRIQTRGLPPSCDPNNCPRPGHPTQRCDGVDVVLGQLYGMYQYIGARQGTYPNGESGFTAATTSCNNGCVRVGWHAPMQVDHPAILTDVFRLADGRLTQIGAHFVMHVYYALSNNQCGYRCEGTSPGDELWIGCGTTRSNNGGKNYLAPRSEWNPFTGIWTCEGSHFSGGQPDCLRRHGSAGHAAIDHLTRVKDQDLLTPGAQYFYEGYYIVKDDVDIYNNIGYKPVTFTWNAGEVEWVATSSGYSTPPTYGVVLNPSVWGTKHVTVDTGAGELVLAMTSSDNGDGTWHYEYAVYNLNYDRRVRSFSVPLASGASVTAVGFHGPPLEEQSQAPWIATVSSDSCTWELDDLATPHNAIIFSSLYNFWFDVDAPPEPSRITMEPYLPGAAGGPLVAFITGPAGGWTPGDFDGDGDVDLDDFRMLAACYNGSDRPPAATCPPGVNADLDGDGDVDLDDLAIFAVNYTGTM